MSTLVPIFVCVVLPVAIVAIIFLTKINNDNKRAKVLIKAIEAGNDIDAQKFASAFQKPRKTEKETLNLRLLRGCIFTLLGVALCVFGTVALCNGSDFETEEVSLSFFAGGALFAVGISYLVVYFVTRKQITEK